MIRAAIITVSDSVARGTREDRSGQKVRELAESLNWAVTIVEVVADERDQIAAKLKHLADSGTISIILTTGGTGIALRDVTPEATRSVIDREIPGLAELMRTRGLEFTPRAALSRAVAGTRGPVLIVNLPGSPKGAVESLDAIVELVPHVLELLRGQTEHAVSRQE